jgi:hypothetical protein
VREVSVVIRKVNAIGKSTGWPFSSPAPRPASGTLDRNREAEAP